MVPTDYILIGDIYSEVINHVSGSKVILLISSFSTYGVRTLKLGHKNSILTYNYCSTNNILKLDNTWMIRKIATETGTLFKEKSL